MSDIFVVLDPRGAWIPPHLISTQYYFTDSDQPPAQETNTHFIGRFATTKHVIRRDLLFHGAWDPVAQETNTHFVGRYRPATHTLLASSRQNPATDIFVAPAVETNPHWFGAHWQTSFNINLANMQGGDFNQLETNPSSIGRFTPTTHKVLASLRQHQDFQTAVVAQAETNVHWLGRHTPTAYKISISLRQHQDFFPPSTEIAASFIARFRPTTHALLASLRQTQAGDIFVTPPFETNTSWLGTFTPTRYIINLGNIQGGDFAQAETNPNFIGRFAPTRHAVARHLNYFQYGWDTSTAPPASETNPNFLGRFVSTKHTIVRHLNHFSHAWDSAPPRVEANPHFLGHFTPYIHTINVANYQQAADLATFETNVSFLGTFTPTRHIINLGNIQGGDFAQVETNPNFIGRYSPTLHRLLPALRQNAATDIFVQPGVQAETNVNFISGRAHGGRFTPTKHSILSGLMQNTDTSESAPPVTTVELHQNPFFITMGRLSQLGNLPS